MFKLSLLVTRGVDAAGNSRLPKFLEEKGLSLLLAPPSTPPSNLQRSRKKSASRRASATMQRLSLSCDEFYSEGLTNHIFFFFFLFLGASFNNIPENNLKTCCCIRAIDESKYI